MADTDGAKGPPGGRPAAEKKAKVNDLKEVKILMLHGKMSLLRIPCLCRLSVLPRTEHG